MDTHDRTANVSPPPFPLPIRKGANLFLSLRKEGLGRVLSLFLALGLPVASNAQTPKKPAPPPAPTKYRIIDLGTLAGTDRPGGAGSDAYGINAQGQVVGRSATASGAVHAFLWTPTVPNGTEGTMIDLGTLPGRDASRAYAIADDGRIAGDSFMSGAKRGDDAEHAFLTAPSAGSAKPQLQDLEPLATNSEVLWNLGPDGQAVGQWMQGAKVSRGFVWTEAHGIQYLTDAATYSVAYSMNTHGWIAGVLEIKPGVRHAVVWHDQTYTDIGLLPEWDQASATAVNDRGQVIGIGYPVDSQTKEEDGTTDSFLWDGGRLRSLRSFGGLPLMTALGINNKTEIVGEADSGDLDGRAFLWRQGKLSDLNGFLPPDSGWQLNGAHAINDAGEIVGYGVHDGGSHAFLMVPLPTGLPTGAK